ncbi:MAG: ankyrin repeat domain-containing protein [Planctomycetota bacterium]
MKNVSRWTAALSSRVPQNPNQKRKRGDSHNSFTRSRFGLRLSVEWRGPAKANALPYQRMVAWIVLAILSASSVAADDSVLKQSAQPNIADLAEMRRWPALAEALIEPNLDPADHVQADGMTALHWASRWNHPVAISSLVSFGFRVDAKTGYGVTPLGLASRWGHLNAAIALLDEGADPNLAVNGNETPLMLAARVGNTAICRHLIKHGAEVNASQQQKQTALMWAAAEGHWSVVDLLLDAGAEYRTKLRSGFTAMHFAARHGHGRVVRRLLHAGADINQTMSPQTSSGRNPRKGTSPLMLAVESGHFETAIDLVDWGADPNDERSGFAPLHALSWVRRPPRGDNPDGDPPPVGSGEMGSLQFAVALIERGADVNLRLLKGKHAAARLNAKGATPMLYAAYTSDLEYARLLFDNGASIEIANDDGTTPILAAAGVGIFVADEFPGTEPEAVAMVRQLIDWGANVNDVNQDNETTMHGAAYRSFPKVVEVLAAAGADPQVWHRKNALKATPRQVAEGKRPGSFKPNAATIAAIDQALAAAGMKADDWVREAKIPDWPKADPKSKPPSTEQ